MLLYCDNYLSLSDADSSVCRISLSCVEYVLILFRNCWRCCWVMLIKSDFSHFSSQHFMLCLHILFTHIFAQCKVFVISFMFCILVLIWCISIVYLSIHIHLKALCTSLTTSSQQWWTQTTILKHLLKMQNLFKYIIYHHNHMFLMHF